MTNIKINSTANGTFTVTADSARFGNNAIMFEGTTREQCNKYIRRECLIVMCYSSISAHRDAAYETMMRYLPAEKKQRIIDAMRRNAYFTSAFILEWSEVEYYAEGIYIKMKGVQTGLNIWIDNKGNVTRKPSKRLLSEKLKVNEGFHNQEGDFDYMIHDIEAAEEEEAIDNAAEDIRTAIECGMIEATPATTTAPTDAAELDSLKAIRDDITTDPNPDTIRAAQDAINRHFVEIDPEDIDTPRKIRAALTDIINAIYWDIAEDITPRTTSTA